MSYTAPKEAIRRVTGIEQSMLRAGIDHRSPEVKAPVRGWLENTFEHMGRSPAQNPQTRLPFLIDAWRQFPLIEFLPDNPQNGHDPFGAYKSEDGEWRHSEQRVRDQMFLQKDKYTQADIINLAFGKGGNVGELTSFIQAAIEMGKPIPEHFILEALILAEMLQARSNFELEFQLGEKAVRRVTDTAKKEDKAKKAAQDPFIHLFQAWELIKYAETQMIHGFS